MAELRGILSKLSGSAGRFTFKRVNGHTIHHEREGVDCRACPKMVEQQWKADSSNFQKALAESGGFD